MPEAREHHYIFAHRVIPAMFFERPADFLKILRHARTAPLMDLWAAIAEDLEADQRLAPEGLAVDFREASGASVAIITLPGARAMPEAHFVALVHRPASSRLKRWMQPLTRCITLEYTEDLSGGEVSTVLGEWSQAGNHANYGPGPDPQLEEFFSAVEDLVRAGPAAPDGGLEGEEEVEENSPGAGGT
jgi:hypothetical protein